MKTNTTLMAAGALTAALAAGAGTVMANDNSIVDNFEPDNQPFLDGLKFSAKLEMNRQESFMREACDTINEELATPINNAFREYNPVAVTLEEDGDGHGLADKYPELYTAMECKITVHGNEAYNFDVRHILRKESFQEQRASQVSQEDLGLLFGSAVYRVMKEFEPYWKRQILRNYHDDFATPEPSAPAPSR